MQEDTGKRYIEYQFPANTSTDKLENDLAAFQQNLQQASETAENYFRFAALLMSKNKIADAIRMLEFCTRKSPDYPEANFLLGNCYIRHDQYEIAARYYLKELKANSNHIPSLFNIGLCYSELRIAQKAISAFKKFYALEVSTRWREEAKYRLYKLGVNI